LGNKPKFVLSKLFDTDEMDAVGFPPNQRNPSHPTNPLYTVGWWNLRQTCPLVSRVGITGQTKSRADVIGRKADSADQGWPL